MRKHVTEEEGVYAQVAKSSIS